MGILVGVDGDLYERAVQVDADETRASGRKSNSTRGWCRELGGSGTVGGDVVSSGTDRQFICSSRCSGLGVSSNDNV